MSTTSAKKTSISISSSDESSRESLGDSPVRKVHFGATTSDQDIDVLTRPTIKKGRIANPVKRLSILKGSKQSSTSTISLDTLLESADFEEPLLRQDSEKPEKILIKAEVLEMVKMYKIRDLLQWRALARHQNHPVKDLTERLVMRKNYTEMIVDCCKAAIFLEEVLPYKLRLRKIPGPQTSGLSFEDYVEVNKFADNFEELFTINHMNAHDMIVECLTILMRTKANENKIRSIYMQGPASSGKSSLLLLFSCLYEDHEIGRFSPLGINSQFWLDDLYGKEIYIGDEAKATPLNIQLYLLLLEGNRDTKTEVKYGGKPTLEPKPVMLACNQHIFADCQAYQTAILCRVLHLSFKRECPHDLNIRPEQRLYKYILRVLAQRHLKNRKDV